jgi:hypothetical protein
LWNHANKFTLNFKDVDLESEWRLLEISNRRGIFVAAGTMCVVQDVVWTMILQDTSLSGKITRMLLNFVLFVGVYNVYYSRKAKEFKVAK